MQTANDNAASLPEEKTPGQTAQPIGDEIQKHIATYSRAPGGCAGALTETLAS